MSQESFNRLIVNHLVHFSGCGSSVRLDLLGKQKHKWEQLGAPQWFDGLVLPGLQIVEKKREGLTNR
jgi:hypothetical protein